MNTAVKRIQEKNASNTVVYRRSGNIYTVVSVLDRHHFFDKIVLYYLVHQILTKNIILASSVTVSIHEAAQAIFYKRKRLKKADYDRIMLSLEKWKGTYVIAEVGERYKYSYSIFDHLIIYGSHLTVTFNAQLLQELIRTRFFWGIDFNEYRCLQSCSGMRLYEELMIVFAEQEAWIADIKEMVRNIECSGMSCGSAGMVTKINAAVREINQYTRMKIAMSYGKHTGRCIIHKMIE